MVFHKRGRGGRTPFRRVPRLVESRSVEATIGRKARQKLSRAQMRLPDDDNQSELRVDQQDGLESSNERSLQGANQAQINPSTGQSEDSQVGAR